MSTILRSALAAASLSLAAVGTASAATVNITVTNEQASGGLFFTPFFLVAHDGSFDLFDPGESASVALEELAEDGLVDLLVRQARGNPNAIAANPAGFGGAPVLDPGESATVQLELDPNSHRYLSYASMIIPSNDAFVGNGNPLARELFDASGNFTGASFDITRAYDAGTEVNDGQGAAFSAAGGAGSDENGTVQLITGGLDFLVDQTTVAGTNIDFVPAQGEVLASVQIELAPVPLPAAAPMLLVGLGGMVFVARRKKKHATA